MLIAQATSLSNGERARSRSRRWAIYSFVALASAQIAIPLSPGKEPLLTGLTVLTLAFTTSFFARLTLKSERLVAVFAIAGVLSFLVEATGTHTGWPFGHYSYTARLAPRLWSVPLVVPLAWFAMSLAARDVARRLFSSRLPAALVGGYLLAAWDMLLDPQMTHARFWVWPGTHGWWQGIPLSNYIGWLIVGFALVLVVDLIAGSPEPNDGLAFIYLWMTGFSCIGFLLPFAFDRPIVGLIGALCCLPLPVVALIRKPIAWRAFL